MTRTHTRDIIVVGTSLGGIDALKKLVVDLPEDLAASVLVVQHVSAETRSVLPDILGRRGPLPAVAAEDGMALKRGRIYLAPSNLHMLLAEDGIRVAFGPRENRSRPAIDPLFRTAAVNYRSRVIGVILTGLLDDGASGLRAVERCGGACVVQAIEDAAYPDMPRSALAAVPGATQVTLSELAPLLVRLCAEVAPDSPEIPEALRIEARLTERAMRNDDWHQVPSHPSDFTCPECNGALREMEGETELRRFRCRVGHAYTVDSLVDAKDEAVEEALWIALQTLQERVQMLETLAGADRGRGLARTAAAYDERAKETYEHAEKLRQFIGKLGI